MKFLLNTLTQWDEPPRARHQIAYSLSKRFTVIFVTANKNGLPHIRLNRIHDNLIILTPYFFIGYKIRYRIPVLNELYQYWLFRKLGKEYKDYNVINFDFTAAKIYNFFTDIIYYCNDNFTAISRSINPLIIARYHKYCESKVAARAKFCVAVSEILRDNLKKFNKNSIEIPLGSPDIDEFNIKINTVPSGNSTLNIGLVGFIGTGNISHKILNLLVRDKNLRVFLIGPVEAEFKDIIDKSDNLLLLGILKGKALYEEINKFDVAIAPYAPRLMNDNNMGVGTGSKIYHYLALGKPVVISCMAGLSRINLPQKLIYLANSDADFISSVYKAHSENSEELIRKRIEYARNNTWDKRMDKLIESYQK